MNDRGRDAEDRACEYLRQQGLRLLQRNFRTRRGELDLVLMDGATVVVAEVRRRGHAAYGGALASIDARKRERIVQATRLLLAQRPALAGRPLRFDVIAIEPTGKLHWIRGAFDAGGF
ncbi:MAG TPA: YraN family protein [Nevskiales bacterium]|nr:YraN family protein [Nevskiales bacterium]